MVLFSEHTFRNVNLEVLQQFLDHAEVQNIQELCFYLTANHDSQFYELPVSSMAHLIYAAYHDDLPKVQELLDARPKNLYQTTAFLNKLKLSPQVYKLIHCSGKFAVRRYLVSGNWPCTQILRFEHSKSCVLEYPEQDFVDGTYPLEYLAHQTGNNNYERMWNLWISNMKDGATKNVVLNQPRTLVPATQHGFHRYIGSDFAGRLLSNAKDQMLFAKTAPLSMLMHFVQFTHGRTEINTIIMERLLTTLGSNILQWYRSEDLTLLEHGLRYCSLPPPSPTQYLQVFRMTAFPCFLDKLDRVLDRFSPVELPKVAMFANLVHGKPWYYYSKLQNHIKVRELLKLWSTLRNLNDINGIGAQVILVLQNETFRNITQLTTKHLLKRTYTLLKNEGFT